MASLENQVTGQTGSNPYVTATDDDGPSSREIRREIERTRSQMDRNLDALEQKLTPSQLAVEAWSLFRGGSTAGAGRLWRMAKEHPGPAAVIGVGLAWLMTDSSKSSNGRDGRSNGGQLYQGYQGGGYGYTGRGNGQGRDHEGRISSALHGAKETLSDAAGTAKHAVSDAASSAKEAVVDAAGSAREAVSDARDRVMEATGSMRDRASELGSEARSQVSQQARRAQLGFWQGMEERPLAIGAAALALGVVAGLLVPSTRKEDELMGETRDQLMDRARELGEEALDKGKQVASVAVDTLKEEAERQELTPGKLAEKVRNVAKEAVSTVKEEGQKQASELKESVTAS